MSFAALCASHAPLVHRCPAGEKGEAFQSAMRTAGEWLRDFAPDLVVQFYPDHFNGFFYDVMPNFCVGAAAQSVGDWGTPAGPVQVPGDLALAMLREIRKSDIDADLSYRMSVDHGFAQLWDMLETPLDRFPVIPIMVNCAAPPAPAFRRVRLLGDVVGRYAATLGKRVLFMGSGGLSHDPPIPNIERGTDLQKEFLIAGRNPPEQARLAREQRVMAAAAEFAAGGGPALAPNPAWDGEFLGLLSNADLQAVDGWSEDEVSARGGCGAHEVRTWIAAFAALKAAAGEFNFQQRHYDVVPDWMTAMGVVSGASAQSV